MNEYESELVFLMVNRTFVTGESRLPLREVVPRVASMADTPRGSNATAGSFNATLRSLGVDCCATTTTVVAIRMDQTATSLLIIFSLELAKCDLNPESSHKATGQWSDHLL